MFLEKNVSFPWYGEKWYRFCPSWVAKMPRCSQSPAGLSNNFWVDNVNNCFEGGLIPLVWYLIEKLSSFNFNRSRKSCIFKPTKLHCSHQCKIYSTSTWGNWQAGKLNKNMYPPPMGYPSWVRPLDSAGFGRTWSDLVGFGVFWN